MTALDLEHSLRISREQVRLLTEANAAATERADRAEQRATEAERQLALREMALQRQMNDAERIEAKLAEAEAACAAMRGAVPPPEVWQSLQRQAGELRAELMNIARAKRFDRERFSSHEDFGAWAQSRAAFTLDHNDAGSGWVGPEEHVKALEVEHFKMCKTCQAIGPKYCKKAPSSALAPAAAHPTEEPAR